MPIKYSSFPETARTATPEPVAAPKLPLLVLAVRGQDADTQAVTLALTEYYAKARYNVEVIHEPKLETVKVEGQTGDTNLALFRVGPKTKVEGATLVFDVYKP